MPLQLPWSAPRVRIGNPQVKSVAYATKKKYFPIAPERGDGQFLDCDISNPGYFSSFNLSHCPETTMNNANFTFHVPTKIYFGDNQLSNLES